MSQGNVDDGGGRFGGRLAAGEQLRAFRKLSRVDFAGGDLLKHRVGVGQLVTFAVLAAGKFDPGPDAVLLGAVDGPLGAEPLLGQREAA
jgi:hypothetical protein